MPQERCITCGRKAKRSTEANRRYWLLLHAIAGKVRPEGQTYSAEQFHIYFKSRYLGCNEVNLPNGKTMLIPNSSADLDTPEFSDYVTQVEAWAAAREVYLADLPA